jgi:O-antigen/teichoic acid export membrane protein
MLQRVARNTLYLFSSSIGQKLLAFFYFIFIARTLGVENTGKYFFAISFVALFSMLVDLGLSPMFTREGAKNPQKIQELLRTIFALKIPLIIGTVIFILFLALVLGYEKETLVLVALSSIVMALDSLHLIGFAAFRALQKFHYEAFGVVVGQIITIATGSAVLLLHLPVAGLIFALMAGSLFNVVFSFSLLWKRGIILFPRFDKSLVKYSLRLAFPFALAALLTRVWTSFDVVLLKYFQGAEAVGFWSIPFKLTFALQFIPAALSSSLYPALSLTHEEIMGTIIPVKEAARERLQHALRTTFRYLLVLAFPVSLGTLLLARPLISMLYGASYLPSVTALQIAILILPPYFLNWQIGSLLAATGRQMTHAILIGCSFFLSTVINLILIPQMGFKGAAIATLASTLFFFMVGITLTQRLTKVLNFALVLTFLKILIVSLIMVAAVLLVRDTAHVVLAVALGAVVYGAGILALRVITFEEVRQSAQKIFSRREI